MDFNAEAGEEARLQLQVDVQIVRSAHAGAAQHESTALLQPGSIQCYLHVIHPAQGRIVH